MDGNEIVWGVGGPRRAEIEANEIFVTMGVNGEFFAFWRFLSDISATRARIHTKYYLCTDILSADVPPPPVESIGPWGAGEWELKTQKIGGGLIRAADSYHFYFSQRCQMWSSM